MIILEHNSQKPTIKISMIIIFIFISFLIILSRLIYLQVYTGEQLYQLSMNNFTRLKTIQSPRGNICDLNGNLLATNRPVKNIIWQGTGMRKLNLTQIETVHKISQ